MWVIGIASFAILDRDQIVVKSHTYTNIRPNWMVFCVHVDAYYVKFRKINGPKSNGKSSNFVWYKSVKTVHWCVSFLTSGVLFAMTMTMTMAVAVVTVATSAAAYYVYSAAACIVLQLLGIIILTHCDVNCG